MGGGERTKSGREEELWAWWSTVYQQECHERSWVHGTGRCPPSLSLSLHVFSVFSTPTREALRALVPHFHLLMSSPPTQRSLQANHRLRGQKYS